jgi:hypothetical protein
MLLVHSTQRQIFLKIQSLSRKPMASHFFAELPNLAISPAPAIIEILDRVVQQSERSQ